MAQRLVSLIAASFFMTAPTLALPPDPVEIDSPRPGELVPKEVKRLEMRAVPYQNATKYECTVTQGSTKWQSSAADTPLCTMSEADLTKFHTGSATLQVRVFHKKWLPAKKVTFEFTGTEAPSDPSVPLKGPGATYAMSDSGAKTKVWIAVGAGKWKVLRPDMDVHDQYITFHRGNQEDATAQLAVRKCGIGNSAECQTFAFDADLSCQGNTGRTNESLGANRSSSMCLFPKNFHGVVETYASGGIAEYDPASGLVMTCGTRLSSPEYFKEVKRFCETAKIVH